MKTSTFASTLALAASATAQYLDQSAPFALVVFSGNETYNGTTLGACHEGAAIEGLCIGATFSTPVPSSVSTYQFNFSSTQTVNPNVGQLGLLAYELRGGNFNESSALTLSYNPTSNVAVPLFYPGNEGQQFLFKSDDFLGIPQFLDDTVVPATFDEEAVYRWYICETNAGYRYTTLAWLVGNGAPQNPSCVSASIKRVFV